MTELLKILKTQITEQLERCDDPDLLDLVLKILISES